MNNQISEVYSFVKKWTESKDADFEAVVSDDCILFAGDFTEYSLFIDDFNTVVLKGSNVEISASEIFYIPIPNNEADFLQLMKLINQ